MDTHGMELSINMVVVIIMGIVLLGMGILFVTRIVDQSIEITDDVDERFKEELRRGQFRDGRLVAVLNSQETVYRGKSGEFLLGFVNKQGVPLDFRVVTEYSTNSPVNDALKASEKIVSAYGTDVTDAKLKTEMNKYMLHLFKDPAFKVPLKHNEDYFINLIFSPSKDMPQGQYLYTVYVCRSKLVDGSETSYAGCDSDTQILHSGNKQRITATVK